VNEALLDVLAAFVPAPLGVDALEGSVRVTLPYVDWCYWAWIENASLSLDAAQSAAEVAFTVPANERAYLVGMVVTRASGDNTFSQIQVAQPTGYGSGTPSVFILQRTAGVTSMFWPDEGGVQAVTWVIPGPLLLEGGATVSVVPDGAGAGVTVVAADIVLKRMKLGRALTP